jgi:hypothetical protein
MKTPRNIKQTCWLWQEKAALRLISEHYSGARLLAARSIYLALTEIASDQHTPSQARAACSYIGTRAGVTEGTARRYLHELANLGLLAIDTAARDWNTYHLLAIDVPQGDDLAVATMPLADGKGISSAPPTQVETPAGAPLDMAKGITGAPQMKKEIPKTNKQTTTGVLVVPPVEIASATTTAADGVVGRLVSKIEEYVAATNPSSCVDGQAGEAIAALTGLGVRRTVAQEVAQQFAATLIMAWVAASASPKVKDRAAWALAMIRTGDAPPQAKPQAGQLDASKYLPGGKYGHLFNRALEWQPSTQGAT